MKNNWKEEFRKEFIGEGYTHPGMESFIESLLEEQKKELIEIIHKQFSYELNGEVLISKYELIDELKHHD